MEKQASQEQWAALFSAAERILEKKPWMQFDASNLIAVQDPQTAEMSYFAFSAADGGRPFFAVYEGEDGLNCYLMTAMYEETGLPLEYAMHRQTCLSCSMDRKERLSPEQIAIAEHAGFAKEDDEDWIGFLSFMSGCSPVVPNADEVARLVRLYENLDEALRWFNEHDLVLEPGSSEMYQYTEGLDGEMIGAVSEFPRTGFRIQGIMLEESEFLKQIYRRPKNGRIVQVDSVILPVTVDDAELDRPMRPAVSVVLDKESYQIEAMNMAPTPAITPPESCFRATLEYIAEHGRPDRIEVSNIEIFGSLQDLCEKCDIDLDVKLDGLPEMAVAAMSLQSKAGHRKGSPIYAGLYDGPLC